MKKIYGSDIYQNERADMVTIYISNFIKNEIREEVKWLENTDEIAQALLAKIDLYLYIAKKFPSDFNLKCSEIDIWEKVFNEWFLRVQKKIRKNYRQEMNQKALELFEDLRKNYGHLPEYI